jgi:hypothetical protein
MYIPSNLKNRGFVEPEPEIRNTPPKDFNEILYLDIPNDVNVLL